MAKKGELFLKTIKYLFSNMITFYLSYCLLSYLTNGLMMKNVKEEPNGSKTTCDSKKMCQMTCCIGLHQMKYVAVVAQKKEKEGIGELWSGELGCQR